MGRDPNLGHEAVLSASQNNKRHDNLKNISYAH